MNKTQSPFHEDLDFLEVASNGRLSINSDHLSEINYARKGIVLKGVCSLASALKWNIEDIAKVLNTTKKSLTADKSKRLNQLASESVLDIARLSNFAVRYFGNVEDYKHWLNTPHIQFDYHPPQFFIGSIIGRKLIKEVITRSRHGYTA